MIKARQNSAASSKDVEDAEDLDSTQVNICVDKEDEDAAGAAGIIDDDIQIIEAEDGRRYSWNPRLQTAEWLDQDVKDEVDTAAAAAADKDEVVILEAKDGRHYSWNPKSETANWLD